MLSLETIGWVKKDKNLRFIFKRNEIKKIILKSLIYSNIEIFYKKLYYDFKFKKYTYKSSIAKTRNSCLFLGNSRAIIQQFKLSRHASKKYAALGFLVGLKKSSF